MHSASPARWQQRSPIVHNSKLPSNAFRALQQRRAIPQVAAAAAGCRSAAGAAAAGAAVVPRAGPSCWPWTTSSPAGLRLVKARFKNADHDSPSASKSSAVEGAEQSEQPQDAASGPELAAATELLADAAADQAAQQQQVKDPTAQEGATQDGNSSTRSDVQQGGPRPDSAQQAGSQKLRQQLNDLSSKYHALDQRLDSLEGTLISLLRNVKEKARRPAAAAAVGPAAEAAPDAGPLAQASQSAQDVPYGDELDDDEGDGGNGGSMFDLKRLQSSISENINQGYLESVKHLREMLMAYEWHLHGKELAERRGVAKFEQHCVEHELEVSFDAITELYANPSDVSVLPDNKTKLLARSIIQQAVDERYCSIYWECTNTAKELAHTGLKDLVPDSAGKVGSVIKDLLPLPGFLKK